MGYWSIQDHPHSLIDLVSLVVLQHRPLASCFACIATQFNETESAVRNAAQLLILKWAFKPARRRCFRCLRTSDTIVRDKDSG
jgi:hypothetical protein